MCFTDKLKKEDKERKKMQKDFEKKETKKREKLAKAYSSQASDADGLQM